MSFKPLLHLTLSICLFAIMTGNANAYPVYNVGAGRTGNFGYDPIETAGGDYIQVFKMRFGSNFLTRPRARSTPTRAA